MTQVAPSRSKRSSDGVQRGDRRWGWLVMIAMTSLVALRVVHLGADVPSDLSPESAGVYVDEGYKTLSPRNLVLFGTTHWNPQDDYRGWMTASLLTQWSHYLLFRLFGATVETARILSIACFALFLLAYLWGLGRRYSSGLLLGGLILLGLEPTLYFFSRTALFETPLILALYGTLFVLARAESRPFGALFFAAAIATVAAFGIKLSALVYFLPVVGAILLISWTDSDARTRVRFYIAATAAVFSLAILLALTHETWGPRIAFSPLKFVSRVFDNPTARVAFPVVLAGLLCVIHLLVSAPHLVFRDTYRVSLTAIAVGGPLLLALFPYDPLRYYVPVLPAYVLLMLEWIHERAWKCNPAIQWFSASAVAAVMLMALWWLLTGNSLSHLLLGKLAFRLRFAAPIAAGLAALSWSYRKQVLSGKRVATVLAVLLSVFALHTSAVLGDFIRNPGYEARAVRAGLVSSVPAGSTIGGDWAPFFALGTDIPALYMEPPDPSPLPSTIVNPIERILEIRPDFYLYSDTTERSRGETAMVALRGTEGVKLGKPVFEGRYNRSSVILYPLEYDPLLPRRDAPRF